MDMFHKDCGGKIVESKVRFYTYNTDSHKFELHPALYCEKCDKEITGDESLELSKEVDI